MNYRELLSLVHALMPEASIGRDNEEQIIIYTNLVPNEHGELVRFEA